MNRGDDLYMAGFHAAVDLAERAGARILAGPLPTLRREHAAAGLLGFVNAAREALERNVAAPDAATTAPLILGAIFTKAAPDARIAARAQGYSGDVCDVCGSLSMKRSGSCLVCEACGTT